VWTIQDVSPLPEDDEETRLMIHRTTKIREWAVQNNFKNKRDIQLMQSLNPGAMDIRLWASGRITETTITDETVKLDKVTAAYLETNKDIAPPYDFLKLSR
jgi:hypothetical protein